MFSWYGASRASGCSSSLLPRFAGPSVDGAIFKRSGGVLTLRLIGEDTAISDGIRVRTADLPGEESRETLLACEDVFLFIIDVKDVERILATS